MPELFELAQEDKAPAKPAPATAAKPAAPAAAPKPAPAAKDKLAAATGGDKPKPDDAITVKQTEEGEFVMEKGPNVSLDTLQNATAALVGRSNDVQASLKSHEVNEKALTAMKENREKTNEVLKEQEEKDNKLKE